MQKNRDQLASMSASMASMSASMSQNKDELLKVIIYSLMI